MTTAGLTIEALRKRRFEPRDRERNPLFAPADAMQAFGPGIGTTEFHVVVDVIGLGSGVYDRLVEQDYPAIPHNSSSRPRKPKQFKNRRAEVFWNVRTMLEENRIALPRDEKLFEELLAHQYAIKSDGLIQIESKEDVRKKLGRSPDRADAVVMALGSTDRGTIGGVMIDL